MGEKIIIPAWQMLRLHRAGQLKKKRPTSTAGALVIIAVLAAAIASAISVARASDDPLYARWQAMDAGQRFQWTQSFVDRAMSDESIGRRQRLSVYVYGCVLEYAPSTGFPFSAFAAFCATMAQGEVR